MFDITESSIIAALIGLFGSMLFLFGFLWTFYLGRKRLGGSPSIK
jgi:hypothetical protein